MYSSKREQLLDYVGSDDVLEAVHNGLKRDGLTTESYAKVFKLLNFNVLAEADRLIYIPSEKKWKRGRKELTDAKLFGLLNDCCNFVRLFVEYSWEECLFSSWVSDKPLKKAEADMDALESLGALQEIINLAADNMSSNDNAAHIQWDQSEPQEMKSNPDQDDDLDD